jgi:dTDP-4-dehydrorhamnose 3,5-epimerase-like enzyme
MLISLLVYVSSGVVRWALFDHRSQSPTYKLLNVFTFSERNRAILVIPFDFDDGPGW